MADGVVGAPGPLVMQSINVVEAHKKGYAIAGE